MHEIRCEKCGNPVRTDIHVMRDLCEECKRGLTSDDFKKFSFLKYNRNRPFQICPICGAPRKKCRRPEICRHAPAFPNYIRYFGFDSAAIGTEKAYDEFDRIKSILHDMYWKQNMSIPEICMKLKYPFKTGNFIKLLKHFIWLRSVEDGIRQYMLKHKDSP